MKLLCIMIQQCKKKKKLMSKVKIHWFQIMNSYIFETRGSHNIGVFLHMASTSLENG